MHKGLGLGRGQEERKEEEGKERGGEGRILVNLRTLKLGYVTDRKQQQCPFVSLGD